MGIYSHIFEVGPEFCCPPKLGSYFSVSKSTVQVPLLTFLQLFYLFDNYYIPDWSSCADFINVF